MKQKIFFTFYAILSISVIAVQLTHLDYIQNILKPLLMPTLIFGFFLLSSHQLEKYDYLIIASLFFSMLGDAFLMPYFNIFMAGLGSFLIAHILYLSAFVPDIEKPIRLNKTKLLFLLPGLIFFIGLIYALFTNLINTHASAFLIIAIGIYASILFSVFVTALLRKTKPIRSYNYILIGAALFLLSDGLLALNKFVIPIQLSRLWVMGTYTSAQAFIMFGVLKRKVSQS